MASIVAVMPAQSLSFVQLLAAAIPPHKLCGGPGSSLPWLAMAERTSSLALRAPFRWLRNRPGGRVFVVAAPWPEPWLQGGVPTRAPG